MSLPISEESCFSAPWLFIPFSNSNLYFPYLYYLEQILPLAGAYFWFSPRLHKHFSMMFISITCLISLLGRMWKEKKKNLSEIKKIKTQQKKIYFACNFTCGHPMDEISWSEFKRISCLLLKKHIYPTFDVAYAFILVGTCDYVYWPFFKKTIIF